MANDFFRFRQFTIRQSHCAMKVGTDGTLLGAWARGGRTILDVGTGTGLIALMMAQRHAGAVVRGIDIDEAACRQASENVAQSPFCVDIRHEGLADADGLYEAIVSNPPYFCDSLECPDARRTVARHASSLSYRELMGHCHRLLADDGELSVVIPAECKSRMEAEAALAGFFKSRECAVRTTPTKPPRRYLLAFRKHRPEQVELTEGVIETAPNVRSEWYDGLTRDFYLPKP